MNRELRQEVADFISQNPANWILRQKTDGCRVGWCMQVSSGSTTHWCRTSNLIASRDSFSILRAYVGGTSTLKFGVSRTYKYIRQIVETGSVVCFVKCEFPATQNIHLTPATSSLRFKGFFPMGFFITIVLTLNTTTLQTRSILRYNYSAGWPWEEEINFNILVRTLPQYFAISDPPAFRDLTLTFSSLKLYESSATCSQELFAYQNLHPFSHVPYLK